jgi:hypothetical protein
MSIKSQPRAFVDETRNMQQWVCSTLVLMNDVVLNTFIIQFVLTCRNDHEIWRKPFVEEDDNMSAQEFFSI